MSSPAHIMSDPIGGVGARSTWKRRVFVWVLALIMRVPLAHAGPEWPVRLPSPTSPPPSSAVPVELIPSAVARAGAWLAAFPLDELRFDAAVMLSQIRRTFAAPALDDAFGRARALAQRDEDHPHRRFVDPSAMSPREHTQGWRPPGPGRLRVGVNYPIAEALHCAENGLRPAAVEYICGPMRDEGGYQTTHALWAVALALENGCGDLARLRVCAREMRSELRAAQAGDPKPVGAMAVDLYAERLLMTVLPGLPAPDHELARLHEQWVEVLLGRQESDGSFGAREDDEPSYARYHATAISAWALSEWYRGVGAGKKP